MATSKTSGWPVRAWLAAPHWLWPVAKWLLTVAVVVAVAWQFVSLLRQPELWSLSFRPRYDWLAAAGVLYLAGLSFSGIYWYWLLRALGEQPRPLATLRAYYVGQIGRYVPGKVAGLAWRAGLLAGPGARLGVAVLTVAYESLTTMASGILLALLVFAWRAPDQTALAWRALGLMALVGVLAWPGTFNRLANWTTRPFRSADAPPLPPVGVKSLAMGLAITACGWVLQGGTLWAVVAALVPDAWPRSADAWGRCTAYTALAYVAGFLVLTAPGGLGVRDFIIQQFLAHELSRTLEPDQAAATAVVATLLVRLLWTILDVAAAGVCWWLPRQSVEGGNMVSRGQASTSAR
jgi:uncharacterized membrane protein YbhN (UPF0104 family)